MKRPDRADLLRAADALDGAAAMSEETCKADGPRTRAARDDAAPDRASWLLVAAWLRKQAGAP